MASYDISAAQASLVAIGGADGYVQVADNSPFYPNAFVWVMKADGSDGGQYQITDLVGTTKIGLKAVTTYPNYGKAKLTAFLVGSTIFQEEQLVRIEETTKQAKSFPNIASLAEIYVTDTDENITLTGAEEILVQGVLNFSAIPSATMEVEVTGLVRSAVGDAALKVYVGGTDGVVDGTVVLTSTPINGAVFATFDQKATVIRPTGVQIVKISMRSSGAAVEAALKSALVRFRGV